MKSIQSKKVRRRINTGEKGERKMDWSLIVLRSLASLACRLFLIIFLFFYSYSKCTQSNRRHGRIRTSRRSLHATAPSKSIVLLTMKSTRIESDFLDFLRRSVYTFRMIGFGYFSLFDDRSTPTTRDHHYSLLLVQSLSLSLFLIQSFIF